MVRNGAIVEAHQVSTVALDTDTPMTFLLVGHDDVQLAENRRRRRCRRIRAETALPGQGVRLRL